MPKTIYLTFLTLLLVMMGCQSNPSDQVTDLDLECQLVFHDVGQTEICSTPQRVIALDPHMLDLLLSLGIQPIGYAERDVALLKSFTLGEPMQVKYLGEYITEPPAYIGNRSQPSLEAILQLRPDLIVGEDSSNFDALSQIAPTILLAGSTTDNWKDNLTTLATIFGLNPEASRLLENHQDLIESTKQDLNFITDHSKVLLLATDGAQFSVFESSSYAYHLLNQIGFNLIQFESEQGTLSMEILPQIEADIIIVAASGTNTIEREKQRWQSNPILNSLKAFQSDHVYYVDYQLWSRIRGNLSAKLIIEELLHFLDIEPS